MGGLWRTSALLLIVGTFQQAPSNTAVDAYNVLNIPEKIIGGVIDIVQNHKNKPTQQSTFQQSVQTQTSFSSAGKPQEIPTGNSPQQTWTGPAYQGTSVQGQAQFQAQGQFGSNTGNYGTGGSYPAAPTAPIYPVNTVQAPAVAPVAYPANPGPHQPQPVQQGFTQTQNQGQYQNYQNQGQFQNQNQQGTFQGQGQTHPHNQNQNGQYQSGQFGNYQQTGQFVGQPSGNYQGSVGPDHGGNYHHQNAGQGSGGNYHGQNVQTTGNYQGQNVPTTGNFQHTQTGQYQGNQNGQYNQNQQGGQYVQPSGQNQQSGYYQGSSQQSVGQTGQSQGSQTGSYGGSQSGGFQTSSSHQSGSPGPSCVCQAWTKPPQPQILSDEPPKPDKIEKNADDTEPAAEQ